MYILTRKIFESKSDALKKFCLKIWRVLFSSVQNLTRNENFISKTWFLKKIMKNANYFVFTE